MLKVFLARKLFTFWYYLWPQKRSEHQKSFLDFWHSFWRSYFWRSDLLTFWSFDVLIILKILLTFWPFDVLIFDVPSTSHKIKCPIKHLKLFICFFRVFVLVCLTSKAKCRKQSQCFKCVHHKLEFVIRIKLATIEFDCMGFISMTIPFSIICKCFASIELILEIQAQTVRE
jgi:hypothetical protein